MNWPRGKVQEFINEITLMSLFKRIKKKTWTKTNIRRNKSNIIRVMSNTYLDKEFRNKIMLSCNSTKI